MLAYVSYEFGFRHTHPVGGVAIASTLVYVYAHTHRRTSLVRLNGPASLFATAWITWLLVVQLLIPQWSSISADHMWNSPVALSSKIPPPQVEVLVLRDGQYSITSTPNVKCVNPKTKTTTTKTTTTTTTKVRVQAVGGTCTSSGVCTCTGARTTRTTYEQAGRTVRTHRRLLEVLPLGWWAKAAASGNGRPPKPRHSCTRPSPLRCAR